MEEGKANVSELITLLRIDIARLDTKLDGLKDLHVKVDTAQDKAKEAWINSETVRHKVNEVSDNQKWLWRTTIAALIVGAIGLLWKGVSI